MGRKSAPSSNGLLARGEVPRSVEKSCRDHVETLGNATGLQLKKSSERKMIFRMFHWQISWTGATLARPDGSEVSYMYSKEGANVSVVSFPFFLKSRVCQLGMLMVGVWRGNGKFMTKQTIGFHVLRPYSTISSKMTLLAKYSA